MIFLLEPTLYFRVLNHSGSQVHDWLSKLLLGPDVRTTQKARAEFEYPPTLGITAKHMDAIMRVLQAWKMVEIPLILAEDATAQHCRADVTSIHKDTLIFGLNGPTIVVQTGAEFEKLVANKQASMPPCCMCTPWSLLSKVPPTFPHSHSVTMVPAGPSRQSS